jgi:hypothetical protein
LRYAVMEMQALKKAGFGVPPPWQEALAHYISKRLKFRTPPS